MFNLKSKFINILKYSTIILLALLGAYYFQLFENHVSSKGPYFVSVDGNDNNNGSFNHPWRSIQKSLDKLEKGAVLNIRAGTYNESIIISKSSTVLKNYLDEKVILSPKNISETESVISIEEDIQSVEVNGLSITCEASAETLYGISSFGYTTFVNILNCEIYGLNASENAHAICFYGEDENASNNIFIVNNKIYNNILGESEAISINGNVTDFYIENNEIYDNDNIGIDIIGYEGVSINGLDYARNGYIVKNTIYNISTLQNPHYKSKSAAGIYVDGGNNVLITQNNISNSDIGIEVSSEHKNKSAENITVRRNTISNCSFGISIGGYLEKSTGWAKNNIFVFNNLKENDFGIFIQQANNNLISRNIIEKSSESIYFKFDVSNDNKLEYNTYRY